MVIQTQERVTLRALPTRALNDVPVQIHLTGLEADSAVTIRAHLCDDFDRAWESWAEFRADENGAVDVGSRPPLTGTYEGIDPMGLIWSMRPIDGSLAGSSIKTGLQPTTVRLTAEIDDAVVATAELERLFRADGVERIDVRERGLVGTLFLPPGDGPLGEAPVGETPFPGVLLFTGSGGGIEEGRAALLASHGFAVFALGYFRAEGLPDSLIDIPLEYFETGLQWMAEQPKVRGDRLGVTGGSRGGELVLLLGSLFPIIGAVVAFVPSGVVWGGFGRGTDELPAPPASWTRQGVPIAFMPSRDDEVTLDIEEGDPIPLTPYFLKSLEYEDDIAAASIPVERTRGPVMLISGQADAMWPSTPMAEMALDRLRAANHPYPDVHLSYPDAGHGIKPPYIPTTMTNMLHPVDGALYALGGTAAGNARANVDSWRRMLEFLHEHLDDTSAL